MNPTKNLIDPKLYIIPTKNLIDPKLYIVNVPATRDTQSRAPRANREVGQDEQ